MIETGARFGFGPREVLDMTVREFNAVLRGAAEAERERMAVALSAAWHGAWLTAYAPVKPNKFPKLSGLLKGLTRAVSRKPRKADDWKRDFQAMEAFVQGQTAQRARR